MKGRRQVKEGFLSLETIETWIVYDLSAFEQGMEVRARHTSLCQELQQCWDFHGQQFLTCIQNGPPHKGHPAHFTQLWDALEPTCARIPVKRFRYVVESMSRGIEAVLRAKGGVQLNIRKVFQMFGILSILTGNNTLSVIYFEKVYERVELFSHSEVLCLGCCLGW